MLSNNNENLRKDRDEYRAKNIEKDTEIRKLTLELRGISSKLEEALQVHKKENINNLKNLNYK